MIDNKKSKIIDSVQCLYGKKIAGACLINNVIFECNGLCSWDLCHSIHHEQGHSSKYRF